MKFGLEELILVALLIGAIALAIWAICSKD